MRRITEIVVHCTATRPEWWAGKPTSEKVEEIRRWHVEGNGWSDIGYHYLIDRDGTVAEGRPVATAGAHVKGHNANSIGVSLFGGHGSSENDRFADHFTPEQDEALRALLQRLGIDKVTGHNQYAAKACPGFNVPRWLAKKSPARETPAKSTTLQASAGGAAAAVGAAGTAVGSLDGTAQIIVVGLLCVVVLGFLWIARERIKKWSAGVK